MFFRFFSSFFSSQLHAVNFVPGCLHPLEEDLSEGRKRRLAWKITIENQRHSRCDQHGNPASIRHQFLSRGGALFFQQENEHMHHSYCREVHLRDESVLHDILVQGTLQPSLSLGSGCLSEH